MDVIVGSEANQNSLGMPSNNAIGDAQERVSTSSPSIATGAVFIKKSAATVPVPGVSGGAVKISGLAPVIGGNAGVKMTASVAMEMPTGFKPIDRNIFVCRPEIKLRTHELPRCHCKEGQRCTPTECENAKLFIECSPERCPVGDQCLNQRFQKRQYAGVVPKRCGAKGWGIFAQLPISAGQFVMEYVGEVIDADELDVRSKACANDPHYYFLSLTGGETIDASKKGNISRFINHSCDPNCITQKWQANGESRVGIFALRNIRVGEELTFDYQFERFSHKKQRCLCGAANCGKYLGSKPKPKDGEKRKHQPKKDEIRYREVADAIFPDEHVAVLLDDQDLEYFPFSATDGKWYYLKADQIPMETDTEDSSDSSSDSSDESESESSTELDQAKDNVDTGAQETATEPPRKARKLQEDETPHTSSSHSNPEKRPLDSPIVQKSDDDSDSETPAPQHRARDFVNRLPNRAPLFRRSQAHHQRLRLLDQYTDMLYEKIDKHKEKKTLMQDAELAAVSSLVGVETANQSWMASLDIKQLIKDGLLEFEPISAAERAQSRRVSTRSSKR